MTVENATSISELDPLQPPGTDPLGEANDHTQMLKTVMKNTFNDQPGDAWDDAAYLDYGPRQINGWEGRIAAIENAVQEYFAREPSDVALAANTDYARVENVVVGVYAYEALATLRRTGSFDQTVSLGVLPGETDGVAFSTASKFNSLQMETDANPGFATLVDSQINTDFGTVVTLNAPASAFGFFNNTICERGVVTVTTPGSVAWKTLAAMTGWPEVLAGTYLRLTKIG